MDIYLDYNVFIDLEEKKELNKELYEKILKELSKHNVVYTYGHLEELSSHLLNQENFERKKELERLNLISEITKNKEIIFDYKKDIFLKTIEPVMKCYERVQKSEKYNKMQDEKFREIHKNNIEDIKEIKNINNVNNDRLFEEISVEFIKYISNEEKEQIEIYKELENIKFIDYECFFYEKIQNNLEKREEIIEEMDLTIKNHSKHMRIYESKMKVLNILKNLNKEKELSKYLNSFFLTEYLYELLFNFLYFISYFKEKENYKNFSKSSTYRGKIFDVTHSIFASHCNIFITSDNRLYKKVNAIYKFLGVNTEVVLINNARQKENKDILDVLLALKQ